MNLPRPPACFLFDNGSLRAESTLSLRRVAAALALWTGREVRAVSLLHSSRVPVEELGGMPASLLECALREFFTADPVGAADLLPLFFGPSTALSEYVPGRVTELRRQFPAARLRLAPCLVDPGAPDDRRMGRILADQVHTRTLTAGWRRPKVILVDHGSPTRAVAAVRDHLGGQLRTELGDEAEVVGVASMERREGAGFEFNEPLLATALRSPPFNCGDVVVALQFLSPGRHAGPDGDLATICLAAEAASPGLRIQMTAPLAAHPLLIEVLAARLTAAREGF
jgi:hypothetical protein